MRALASAGVPILMVERSPEQKFGIPDHQTALVTVAAAYLLLSLTFHGIPPHVAVIHIMHTVL